ncbi:MAG: zf-HC2 domain-containing protein [Chlorobiaceae bacterium]
MSCKKALVLVSAAVDCELTLKEEQEFQMHLTKCNKCSKEFSEAKKTKMIIKEQIIQFKAPQSLVNSIMQLTSITTKEFEDALLYD